MPIGLSESENRGPKFEVLIFLMFAALLAGCAHRGRVPEPTVPAEPVKPGTVEKGIASWYGEPYHGRRTASGEIYDMYRMTGAHRTLPFDSVVRVTRRDTGQRVEVRINDRGPFIEGRIIDLSYSAAQRIGLDIDGIAPVKVEVLDRRASERSEPVRAPAELLDRDCWWVQVGAFADQGNARRAEGALEAAGERAVVMESGDGLHRVRVGPMESKVSAEKTRERIQLEWPEATLVQCGG
jgi:rare lipoprotein A